MKIKPTVGQERDLYNKVKEKTRDLIIKLAVSYSYSLKDEDRNNLILASKMLAGGTSTFEFILPSNAVIIQIDDDEIIRAIVDNNYINCFSHEYLFPLLGIKWSEEVCDLIYKIGKLRAIPYSKKEETRSAQMEIDEIIANLKQM